MMHPNVTRLLSMQQWEQRTPEWYEVRKTLLTASDVASALGVKPFKSYPGDIRADTLEKKVQNTFVGNIYTEHGVKYEDEARRLFEMATGEKVLEFGLLVHPEHTWLAASPDGVTRTGKCVEIKCPMTRVIDPGHPPHHYIPQMQVQMAVCGMDATYFVQYKPACLMPDNKPLLEISVVEFDRLWFSQNLPLLRSFFDDYMALMETHVPQPAAAPRRSRVQRDLYI